MADKDCVQNDVEKFKSAVSGESGGVGSERLEVGSSTSRPVDEANSEEKLDAGLEESFPGSDALASTMRQEK